MRRSLLWSVCCVLVTGSLLAGGQGDLRKASGKPVPGKYIVVLEGDARDLPAVASEMATSFLIDDTALNVTQ